MSVYCKDSEQLEGKTMKDFRVFLRFGDLETNFFHQSTAQGNVWDEVADAYEGADIVDIVPVTEEEMA